MVYIAICDDESIFVKAFTNMLEKLLKSWDLDCEIAVFENGKELLLHKKSFDVYFLDFEMPELDGFKLAEKIRNKWGNLPKLVFVTSHPEMVYDAFQYGVTAFIRKSNLEKDLEKNMHVIVRRLEKQNVVYEIKADNKIIYKKVEKIVYIEVYAHQLIFHCDDGDYTMREKLENAEERLRGCGFIKTHRCYLINMQFLKRIETKQVVLDVGKIINIPLSKYRIQQVKSEFLNYTM